MAYASKADLIGRIGVDRLMVLADRDGDGELDGEGDADGGVVGRELSDATGEINTYVRKRHPLPLPVATTPILRALTCDLAVFGLANPPTDNEKYRYEQAIKWLEKLARDEVDLDLDQVEEPPNAQPVKAHVRAEKRIFTRSSLGGLV